MSYDSKLFGCLGSSWRAGLCGLVVTSGLRSVPVEFLDLTPTTNFCSLYAHARTPAFLLFLKAIFITFCFALFG